MKLSLSISTVAVIGIALSAGMVLGAPAQTKLEKQQARKAAKAEAAKLGDSAVTGRVRESAAAGGGRRDVSGVAGEIDRLIDLQLTEKGVAASPLADDSEFIRRVYLDITGRVPSASVVSAFLSSGDAGKRGKVIDELLASPHFGESFAGIWRHVLVPPDANLAKPPNYAAFESWLAGKLNEGRGFDQVVREMLMADGPIAQSPQGIFFIANGDAKGFPQADILTRTVSQAFMGVQLQCAQCHDHPFNKEWKQADFWGMAAFFGRVQNSAAGNKAGGLAGIVEKIQQPAGKKGKPVAKVGAGGTITIPEESFHNVGTVIAAKFPEGEKPTLGNVPELRPAFAAWLTAPENKYFAPSLANRFWEHFMGRGIVNPVDDFSPENLPSHPELLAALAKELVASGFDVKDLIRCICNSRAYQRSSVPLEGNKGENKLFARMEIKVLSPEALADSLDVALEGRGALPAAAMVRGVKKGGGYPANTPRDHFVSFFNTKEEGAEASDYSYGIPQALMLMNQVQFNSGGGVVEKLIKSGMSREKVVEQLYLATLSRKPSVEEMRLALGYVMKQSTVREGYNGLVWTLVNRSEFVLNH